MKSPSPAPTTPTFKKIASTLAIALMVGLVNLVAPQQAHALTAAETLAASVQVSVDGVTTGIASKGVRGPNSNWGSHPTIVGAGTNIFGSTGESATPTSVIRKYFTTKKITISGQEVDKWTNFTAQGGAQIITCTNASKKAYRLAQITLSNLSIDSSTADVYVFWDATLYETSTINNPAASVESNMVARGAQMTPQFNYPYSSQNISETTTVAGLAGAGGRQQNRLVFDRRCDGNQIVETATAGTTMSAIDSIPLRNQSASYTTAGVKINLPAGSVDSLSFKVWVPADVQDSQRRAGTGASNRVELAFLIDKGTRLSTTNTSTNFLNNEEDLGIQTQISTKTFGIQNNTQRQDMVQACNSPTATAWLCYNPDTALTSSAGTSLGNFTVEGDVGINSADQSSRIFVEMRRLTATEGVDGYKVPVGAIAKIELSIPSDSYTANAFTFRGDTQNYSNSILQTKLKIDPNGDAAKNKWDLTQGTVDGRRIVKITGEVRTSSIAISRDTWREECEIVVTTSVTATGCGSQAELDDGTFVVIDTNWARFALLYQNVAEFSPLAGSLVSTNAQNYSFGSKTSAGTAFAFGVAGPSEKEDGTQRTTDGFYYVCLPSAFLSTKFNTTPTNAARYWMGTRDGAKDSPAVAAIGNCGVGAGLVGSRINFQFSTPLFSWEPDTALIAAEEASAAAASAAAAQAAQAAARAAAVAQSKTELTTTVTTGKAPTATQYAASDITGVTAKNVDAINKEVLALSAKDQADISKVQMIAKKYELADRFAAGKPASLSELISAGLLEKTNPVRSTIAAKLKKLPAASVDTVAKLQQVIAAEVATYNARKAKIDARKAKAAK